MAPVRDLTPGGADPSDLDDGLLQPRERHPEDPAWRADALAASRHTRLADEIHRPLDDFDPDRASRLCAEICRELLRDYAPGLIFLDPPSRRRAQALAAYARTLFDFAAQRGLPGERLAQINRWEFALEAALGGEPAGQPIFVALARCERERPWTRDAFDRLGATARRRATAERPWSAAEDRELARTVLEEAARDISAPGCGPGGIGGSARLRRHAALTTSALAQAPRLGVARRLALLLAARLGFSSRRDRSGR